MTPTTIGILGAIRTVLPDAGKPAMAALSELPLSLPPRVISGWKPTPTWCITTLTGIVAIFRYTYLSGDGKNARQVSI
jgi:hypothetical protein